MLSCAICVETLKSPVALPCGHVYCRECILHSVHKSTTRHRCPTCRQAYRIVNVNPSRIPSLLLPHVFPTPKIKSRPSTDIQIPLRDSADLQAENDRLRLSSKMWRTRAEVHAAATLGILNLARTARDDVMRLKNERNELQLQYDTLKRKLEESDDSQFSPVCDLSTPVLSFTPPITLTSLRIGNDL